MKVVMYLPLPTYRDEKSKPDRSATLRILGPGKNHSIAVQIVVVDFLRSCGLSALTQYDLIHF